MASLGKSRNRLFEQGKTDERYSKRKTGIGGRSRRERQPPAGFGRGEARGDLFQPRYPPDAHRADEHAQAVANGRPEGLDLLGATFLVFSLSVSRALTGEMPVSLMILASFSFASSLCAVMAVLPKVGRPDGPVKNRNLIFFGHYTWMDEDEWTEELLARLETDRTVFETMAHDMYQNGQVLAGKKYRFLALAYKVFMTGLFVTLAVFGIEMAIS